MGKLLIECETGKVSDGFHTFDELYEHRCVLFMIYMAHHPSWSWRSRLHSDGKGFEGWFIAGMTIPTLEGDKPVTYHLPDSMWTYLDGLGIKILDRAPEWDGHTSQDVYERLLSCFKRKN